MRLWARKGFEDWSWECLGKEEEVKEIYGDSVMVLRHRIFP
jgi:hypothetical protein